MSQEPKLPITPTRDASATDSVPITELAASTATSSSTVGKDLKGPRKPATPWSKSEITMKSFSGYTLQLTGWTAPHTRKRAADAAAAAADAADASAAGEESATSTNASPKKAGMNSTGTPQQQATNTLTDDNTANHISKSAPTASPGTTPVVPIVPTPTKSTKPEIPAATSP